MHFHDYFRTYYVSSINIEMYHILSYHEKIPRYITIMYCIIIPWHSLIHKIFKSYSSCWFLKQTINQNGKWYIHGGGTHTKAKELGGKRKIRNTKTEMLSISTNQFFIFQYYANSKITEFSYFYQCAITMSTSHEINEYHTQYIWINFY